MKIRLNTINEAKDFVNICSKYHDDEIYLNQGKYTVDGKSILGVFSLNLLEPVKVVIDSDYDNDKIAFYNDIRKWRINSNGTTIYS